MPPTAEATTGSPIAMASRIGHAESLVAGGHHEDVERGEHVGDLSLLAEKFDDAGDVELSGEPLQGRPFGAVAADHAANAQPAGCREARERAEEHVVALASFERRDDADRQRFVDTEALAGRRTTRGPGNPAGGSTALWMTRTRSARTPAASRRRRTSSEIATTAATDRL